MPLRRLILAALLALHATTSLCGPGHHALDGLLGGAGGDRQAPLPDRGPSGPLLVADDSCPVCDHAALASLPILPAPAVAPELRPEPPRPEAPSLVARRDVAASPRAPPRLPA